MDIDKIVDQILSELGLTVSDTLSRTSDILCIDAVYALVIEDSIKGASEFLEVSENVLEQTLRRHFREYCGKTSKMKWNTFLLDLVKHRKCIKCECIYPHDLFSVNKDKSSNVNNICKKCDADKAKNYRLNNLETCKSRSNTHYLLNKQDYLARNANRKALKLKATPSWADLLKIRQIYRECPEGYHVDHIIPLNGVNVCGLHVENNLQHLPAAENLQKYNKFTGE